MIIVEGWVRMSAEDIERLRPAAADMVRATLAEPGCLDYAYAVDLADPGLLRVTERWADQAALDAHFRSPHMAQFNAALAGAAITGLSIRAHDAYATRVLMER